MPWKETEEDPSDTSDLLTDKVPCQMRAPCLFFRFFLKTSPIPAIFEVEKGGVFLMPKFSDYTFLSTDNKTDIYVREFVPDGEIKGVVQIAHGVAEYAARYDDFMSFLAENGYVAAANDHLGHGKSVASEGSRGFFTRENGWDAVVGDMKKLHDLLKERFPDKKMFLFGHSMGSFLSRTYIIKYPKDKDAAIICGTGQQPGIIVKIGGYMANRECKKNGADKPSPKLEKMAFGGYNKQIKNLRTHFDWLSRNKENVDRYVADPLCGGTSSAGLFRDMMHGLAYNSSKKNIAKMNKDLPIYLIAGAKDPVGSYGKGVQKVFNLYKAAGIKDVSMTLYPDDRHEILNEDDRETVYLDILGWMEKH